jgi:hypothetical protein
MTRIKRAFGWAMALWIGRSCAVASGEQPVNDPQDKSHFTLFNPTPPKLMREMSTDRPDTTESPYTVDAGHFQVELSLFDYGRNDDDGERADTVGILPSNIKAGLLNNVDIQFALTPYERVRTRTTETTSTAEGFSDDAQVRLKINLWGNDDGDTSFALMPFIKFPIGSEELSNDHVEGGLIVPLAIALPNEFSLGLMAEIDWVYNEASDDYGIDFVHTATISRTIVGNLSGFIEYVGIAPHDSGSTYQAIASGGLTYALTDDWILDCGVTAGISDSADDFTVFVGTSFRH